MKRKGRAHLPKARDVPNSDVPSWAEPPLGGPVGMIVFWRRVAQASRYGTHRQRRAATVFLVAFVLPAVLAGLAWLVVALFQH